jgi:hypothetical protein
MTDPTQTPTPPVKPAVAALGWPGLVVAAAVLALFGWLTIEMFEYRCGWPETTWTRSMGIYSAIQSFAIAAASALLGVQIQRDRVHAAEARADAKSQQADAAKSDALQAKSELGGYQRVVQQVRDHLGTATDQGGGAPADLVVVRKLLDTLE